MRVQRVTKKDSSTHLRSTEKGIIDQVRLSLSLSPSPALSLIVRRRCW
jgi:hypothetical protein